MKQGVTYLNVPYREKDQAKNLGAFWDPEEKKWYVPSGKNLEDFTKWLDSSISKE